MVYSIYFLLTLMLMIFSKIRILIVILFLLIFSSWLGYKVISFTPVLNDNITKKLLSENWFYFPGDLYFISLDNTIYAKDMVTEQLLWKYEIPEPKPEHTYIENLPLLDKDMVYFVINNKLYALDKSTGTKKWSFEGIGINYLMPDFDNDTIFWGNKDGIIYSIDKKTGKQQWLLDLKNQKEESIFNAAPSKPLHPKVDVKLTYSDAKPSVTTSRVKEEEKYNYYFKFYKLDNLTGDLKKSFRVKRSTSMQMIKESDRILDWQDRNNYLNGNSLRNNFKIRNLTKSLSIYKDNVYLLFKKNSENYLYAIDKSSGQKKWRLKNDVSIFISSPNLNYFDKYLSVFICITNV